MAATHESVEKYLRFNSNLLEAEVQNLCKEYVDMIAGGIMLESNTSYVAEQIVKKAHEDDKLPEGFAWDEDEDEEEEFDDFDDLDEDLFEEEEEDE